MIQTQLKLRMCKTQEKTAESWLPILGSVFNFAVRKIELNAKDKIYFSKNDFQNLLANHGERLEIPSHTLQGVLCTVHDAWKRCFKKIAGKPRLKGMRNKLTSIPFPDPIKAPKGNRITLPVLGSVRFHKMDIPEGKIKCGRIVKRASGWYLCLFVDAEPKAIERKAFGEIGIDSGFKNLLTTSDGEIIEHPRELEAIGGTVGTSTTRARQTVGSTAPRTDCQPQEGQKPQVVTQAGVGERFHRLHQRQNQKHSEKVRKECGFVRRTISCDKCCPTRCPKAVGRMSNLRVGIPPRLVQNAAANQDRQDGQDCR